MRAARRKAPRRRGCATDVPRKAVRAHNSWRLRGVRVVCQPLAKRINTQASPASDQVFTVHALENAGKLLQEAGAGEGERLFVCVIRSLWLRVPEQCWDFWN